MSNQLLKKIHSKGYWRVNIRPITYNEQNIPNLSKCREIAEACKVSLSGWDYPYINNKNNETFNGDSYISSSCDYESYIEYMRLYQSGQFIHHFAIKEDWYEDKPRNKWSTIETKATKFLEIVSTTFLVTEIYEFASRLTQKEVLIGGAEITIELNDTEGRQLYFWDPMRTLFNNYVCQIPKISCSKKHSETELITNSSEIALEVVNYIFERFNWNQLPIEVLRNDQKKLLERRF